MFRREGLISAPMGRLLSGLNDIRETRRLRSLPVIPPRETITSQTVLRSGIHYIDTVDKVARDGENVRRTLWLYSDAAADVKHVAGSVLVFGRVRIGSLGETGHDGIVLDVQSSGTAHVDDFSGGQIEVSGIASVFIGVHSGGSSVKVRDSARVVVPKGLEWDQVSGTDDLLVKNVNPGRAVPRVFMLSSTLPELDGLGRGHDLPGQHVQFDMIDGQPVLYMEAINAFGRRIAARFRRETFREHDGLVQDRWSYIGCSVNVPLDPVRTSLNVEHQSRGTESDLSL